MCGEIEDWQVAKEVNVRLNTTTGPRFEVVLNQKFDHVEEIRLDEVMVTNFQGGTSGAFYLEVFQNGMTNASVSNENKGGLLVPVDVLNPHTYYSRPRVLSRGDKVSISQFGIAAFAPDGTPVTFDEMTLALTFVCRRSSDSIDYVRRMRAQMAYPPTLVDVRSTFNPRE